MFTFTTGPNILKVFIIFWPHLTSILTGCWHVPIQAVKHQYKYYIPYQWVCIQHNNSKKKKTIIKEEEVVLKRKKTKLKLTDYNLLDSSGEKAPT